MADKVKANNNTNKNTNTNTNKNDKQPENTKSKSGNILKIILILFILLILAATGFALGIYLKFIDVQELADKWNLSKYPVIGQYFSQPKSNFEPVDLEQQNPLVISPNPIVPVVVPSETMLPEKRKIDDSELQKQAKIKQQEEAKRISKLARLYSAMKPDEAVAILNRMDDETVLLILNKMEDEQVAKIMALFDARRAAIISQSMLRGRNTN